MNEAKLDDVMILRLKIRSKQKQGYLTKRQMLVLVGDQKYSPNTRNSLQLEYYIGGVMFLFCIN